MQAEVKAKQKKTAKPAPKPAAKKKRKPTANDFADDEPKPKQKRPYGFQKGEIANPYGGGPNAPLARRIRTLTRKELIALGNLVVQGNVHELRRIKKDIAHSSTLKVMLASVALRVIEKGDVAAMEALLNRLIGKVPDKLHHEGLNDIGPQVIVTVPSNGREAPTITKVRQ